MTRRWIGPAILAAVLMVGASACGNSGSGLSKNDKLVEARRGDLTVTVNGTGNIRTSKDRSLTFGTSGRIQKLPFEKGARVLAGDVLAVLETSAYDLAVLRSEDALARAERALKDAKEVYKEVDRAVAESTLAAAEAALTGAWYAWAVDQTSAAKWAAVKSAEADLERARETRRKIEEGPDPQDLAAAERQVKIAQATLQDARRQLRDATIIAPFDGVVASVDVYLGDMVTPATPVVHVVDPGSRELRVEIDEVDMSRVKTGQKAVIEVEALPEVKLKGEVTYIHPLSKETFGVVVYEVTLKVEVPSGIDLLDGMSATADIVVDEISNVVLVPSRAIKKEADGRLVVRVMVDEKAKERAVVVGVSNGTETHVIEGIKEGEKVIVGG